MNRIWDSDSDKENNEIAQREPREKGRKKQKANKAQQKLGIKSPLPGLDSLYSTAIVLGYFGYQDRVQSLLNLLC